MNRKVIVPAPISALIGRMCLLHEMVNRLLNEVRQRLPRDYPTYQRYRVADHEDDECRHRFTIEDDDGIKHLFVFRINDRISPDHLIIEDIQHRIQE